MSALSHRERVRAQRAGEGSRVIARRKLFGHRPAAPLILPRADARGPLLLPQGEKG